MEKVSQVSNKIKKEAIYQYWREHVEQVIKKEPMLTKFDVDKSNDY